MELEQLRAQRSELTTKARTLVDGADAAKRELSTEEARQWQDYMSAADALRVRIDREEAMRVHETEVNQSRQAPTRPDVAKVPATAAGEPRRFRSLGEQLQSVIRASRPGGYVDPRLLEMRAISGLGEAVPSDGGFLVQPDFSGELLKRVYETGQVASRCRRFQVTGNGLKINAIDETSRADGSRWGGVKAYWTAEAGDKTPVAPHFRQVELSLKKLTGLAYVTDELLEDSAALGDLLTQAFTEEIGFRLDDAIINGDGAGKPLGILASPALVSVAIEGGQAADTIVAANVMKMWSRCYAKSRLNAVWFVNQDIEPQLMQMNVDAGTAAALVYMPPGGLSQQPYGSLFGRPVIAIEQCQTLGDKGDIILADLSQYVLVDKASGIQSASSIHVRFANDESVFRFVYRVDGQSAWQSVLTPFTGSANTLSPFVTLAARA